MKLETAFAAHRGGRDEQQDRVAVFSAPEGDARLLVVADGMGGHAGGSIAAQAVVDAAKAAWNSYRTAGGDPKALLQDIIESAHSAINAAGEEKGLSPRSTCVALYLDSTRAVWVHVGDSRLYRFRAGRLVERTRDHSVVQMLLDMGKITEEEMGTHPDQNRLTQSMGGENTPEAEYGEQTVESGDSFLLCSDGLWEMVSPEEMASGVTSEPLAKLAEQLPLVAFERAGAKSDNISIAIARVGSQKGATATPPVDRPAPRRRGAIWGAVAVVLVAGVAGVVALTQFSGPSSETKAPLSPAAAPPAKPDVKPDPKPVVPTPTPKPDPKPGVESKPAPKPKPDPVPTPKTATPKTATPKTADPKPVTPTEPAPAPKDENPQDPSPSPHTAPKSTEPGPTERGPTEPGPTSPATPKSGDIDDRKNGAPGPGPSETPPTKSDAPKSGDPARRLAPGPAEAKPAPKAPGNSPGESPGKSLEKPRDANPNKTGGEINRPGDETAPKANDPPRDDPTAPPARDSIGGDAQ